MVKDGVPERHGKELTMLILLIVGLLEGVEVDLRGEVAEWPRPLNSTPYVSGLRRTPPQPASGYG